MNAVDDVKDQIRAVRKRYDALSPGDRAVLRRCKSSDEVMLEGAYWRVAGEAHRRALADVVLLFGEAPHRATKDFSLGRHLRTHLSSAKEGHSVRVRRLVQCERDDLAHRLRGLLRLTSAGHVAIDWGVLGADIFFFGDAVRRRWTQDFFAPISLSAPASQISETKDHS